MAKVLLVDDDVDFQEANKTVLKAKGHDVQLAYSAAEAREAIKKNVPDIVVLDVMMEKTDSGFDLSREIRAAHPKLPILMLTSIHDRVDKDMRFKPDEDWLPVTKFVEKPLPLEQLAREVDALLAEAKKQK